MHQRAVVDTDRMGPVALAVQNPDIPVVEVDVRGAQRQGLSEPQTGAVNGESATAQGLTALVVDDTKCAETNGGQSRSARTRQRQGKCTRNTGG